MNNIQAKNFYSYFKECYKLDYREFSLDNILSTKYKYKWFATGKEELFNKALPILPFNNSKSELLEKEIELYKLEKTFYYGCFFILGKSDNPKVKDKRVCAPLLLYPCTIETEDAIQYIKIDNESPIVNRGIISKLDLNDASKSKDSFINQLVEYCTSNITDNAFELKKLLDIYFCNIDTEELVMYPNLWNNAKTKSYFNKTTTVVDSYKIIPAAGTVLIEKSLSSLKVLEDLESMALKNKFNNSLEHLLSGENVENTPPISYFKSRLNENQFQALQNASTYSNSVIIGPPGTGKSYTIASIVADTVIQGKSVLVVSKTKQAVEVIRRMLEKDFKLQQNIIHTTGHRYKVSLKAKIRRQLSGISARKTYGNNLSQIENLHEILTTTEKDFTNFIEKELYRSNLEFKSDLTFSEKFKLFINKVSYKLDDEIWVLFQRMNSTSKLLERELKVYVQKKISKQVDSNAFYYRKELSAYYDSLDSASFSEYKKIIESVDYRHILKVFPIWLANLSELNSVLPLKQDLFDLVIIDEATQCDIASALPAIYRAKKVIITGDPNQLKHYSFVSKLQQSKLLTNYNLPTDKIFDYRNRSILDVYISKVQNQNQVTFLREHYRSTPSLIEFNNKQFYEGQLEIMKSTPEYTSTSQIKLEYVGGRRNEKGINAEEAVSVFHKLDTLITKYKDLLEVPSIGIISPFSSQVTYLNSLLKKKYALSTLKKFDLLCGTPYNFQGSEREIILISFTVCKDTHHTAYYHLNKPEVLNVATTRAKSFQYVYTSVTEKEIKNESLLAKYFSFIKNYQGNIEKNSNTDIFQNEVVKILKTHTFENIKCSYPVAGSILDILVVHNNINYFIDLVGYPGQFLEAFTIERYKTLNRIGINCLPLHYSYWKNNQEKAIKKIINFINN